MTAAAHPPPRPGDPSDRIAALRARYGAAAARLDPVWNETLAGLLGHRSIRNYLPDALPAGTLEALIAAAQSASSSSNLQLWSVVAVEDPDRKARLAHLAGRQAHIREAPLFLVWLADLARAERIAAEAGRGDDALHVLETFVVGVVDAALAAQNAVVALESLGLGSVYIGGIRNQPEAVAVELGLPPLVLPVFALCVGRPDPTSPASVKPRLPQAVVLHRERYALAFQDRAIAAYDETLSAFQASQGQAETGWSRTIINRLSSVQMLNGRERLRYVLHAFGFELR